MANLLALYMLKRLSLLTLLIIPSHDTFNRDLTAVDLFSILPVLYCDWLYYYTACIHRN